MVSSASPPSSESAPPERETNPANSRSSEDLPTPLGPSTTRASPAASVKLNAEKTWRPPRKQARSDPKRRIELRPPAANPGPGPPRNRKKETLGPDRPEPTRPRPTRPDPCRGAGEGSDLPAKASTTVDYLEQRKKRTYKQEPSGLNLTLPAQRS